MKKKGKEQIIDGVTEGLKKLWIDHNDLSTYIGIISLFIWNFSPKKPR